MKIAILFLIVSFTSLQVFAQGNSNKTKVKVPEIAIMDIESGQPSPDIILQVLSPNEAGLAPSTSFEGMNSIWLNYTTITKGRSNGTKKDILVKISNGQLPEGVQLQLKAYEATNNGKGKKGSPKSETLVITSTDQGFIGEIESSYTGNGAGKGHLVEYSLIIDEENIEGLDASLNETEISITYTLSDA